VRCLLLSSRSMCGRFTLTYRRAELLASQLLPRRPDVHLGRLRYSRTALVVVLIAGAIGLMMGCSGGGGQANSASVSGTPLAGTQNVDVCSLVTRQEATAYLGTTISDRAFAEPIQENVGSGVRAQASACAYSSKPTGSYVKIDLWQASGQANQIKQLTQNSCAGHDEIPNFGDFACWYNSSHSELQLVKGEAYVHFTSTTSGSAPDALKTIAETALSRLP
jgi:hypothetical protein